MEDHEELKRLFEMFDGNGDGSITKRELTGALQSLGIEIPEKDLEQMMERFDVNGDGRVDMGEFRALYKELMEEKDEEKDIKGAFGVFDRNGDGFITVDELRSVLESLGLNRGRSVEECMEMIKKVDVDGDGMVDYKEFRRMMKGGGFGVLDS